MQHTHSHFKGGLVTDNDSSDNPGESVFVALNIDLNTDDGIAATRKGVEDYAELGDLPEPAGYRLFEVCCWDSGIVTVQHNTMLIFRRWDGAWKNYFLVYSNAPNGGNSSTATAADWTDLTNGTAFSTAICRPIASNGQVRVALGNQLDYMIHCDLLNGGGVSASRVYPEAITIDRLSNRTSELYGQGGLIYKGWLWDHGRLYYNTDTIHVDADPVTGTSGNGLPFASWKIACVWVIDEGDMQFGPTIKIAQTAYTQAEFVVIDRSNVDYLAINDPRAIRLTFHTAGAKWMKRATHVAVYVQRYEEDNIIDDDDWYRIKMIPFDSSFDGLTFDIGIKEYLNIEGVWSVDGGGRPMPATKAQAEDDIRVKPSGFMQRRKRLYAWGCQDDIGQSRVRMTIPDNIQGGQLDVFWKMNKIWREGSQEVTGLVEWMDRMLMFNAHNCYYIDLEQRIDDQYMTIDTGFGIGTDNWRSIVWTPRGVFWFNETSAYKFTNGRPVDLMFRKIRREWQAIPAAYRAAAIGVYHQAEGEFWIVVQTGDYQTTVYVWADDPKRQCWVTYRFQYDSDTGITYFVPNGAFNDRDNRLVLYGWKRSNGDSVAYRFGSSFDDAGDEIVCQMGSQWIGDRRSEMVLETLDILRRQYVPTQLTSTNKYRVRLYVDRHDDIVAEDLFFTFMRRHPATLKRQRVLEYRWLVEWQWKYPGLLQLDTEPLRDEVYQLTVEYHQDKQRRM